MAIFIIKKTSLQNSGSVEIHSGNKYATYMYVQHILVNLLDNEIVIFRCRSANTAICIYAEHFGIAVVYSTYISDCILAHLMDSHMCKFTFIFPVQLCVICIYLRLS